MVMFIRTVHKSTLQTFGLVAAIVFSAFVMLKWSSAAATGVSRGLSICTSVIIPSLFPFLVLAGFLVKSGISAAMGRRLGKLTQFLFGLPGCCAAAILISFIGGYPAGGIAIGEMVKKGEISRQDGRRLLQFCVNGGPAFIISAVGAGMMGSVGYGVILFSAHILASLVIGISGRFTSKIKKTVITPDNFTVIKPEKTPAPTAFVESVNSACRSLLYMCGFIVLFAALLSLADATGFSRLFQELLSKLLAVTGLDTRAFSSVFPCIMEVSCGCVEASRCGPFAPVMLGMALGWGGLSVHCQLASVLYKQKLITKRFFAARAMQALLGGLFTLILYNYIPMPITASVSTDHAIIQPYSGSVVSAVALLAVCTMLLLVTNKQGKAKFTLEK